MSRKIPIFFIIIILIFVWFFSGWPVIWQNPRIPPEIKKIYAANYLNNPSFTGGTTNWTLSTMTYDSTVYQDSAGSIKLQTAVGRNSTATGYAQQTISTNIESGSTVKLSLYWSKQCVAVNCATNTIQINIIKPSSSTVTIWSDATIPAFGSRTSWTGPSNLDVSSYFNETGQYQIRAYASLKNRNNKSAQALAWFDNLNLDVTSPYITVGATGTQTSNIESPSTNSYLGGAFTFVRNAGTANITQIVIKDQGTISSYSDLSNLDIYYETAGTCTYNGNETLFGTATSFNASDQATITGTMAVGTSQVCVYAVVDVGSGASVSETIELEISNPSTDVTVSAGTVSGSSAVQISGTSTITKPYVTIGTTGTQTANVNYDSTNNYIGGAFTAVRSASSANITQIIVNEKGTVSADSNLSNLDIYYETAGTCTYDGNENLFGTASSFSSEAATITGTIAVGTSQICIYAVLDVGSGASHNETIELEISNPSTDVTVSSGTVSGSSAVQISGTTTILKPTITVGTTGTQTANLYNSTNNNYVGGAFTFVRNTGSANITQIIINEEGTVNANSNLSNLDIYYETAGTCTYDGNETLFGTATSFNASDQATITGTMAVGTSQICVYAVLDVGSAYGGSSVELEISNPSTDVTVSSGIVDGTSAVQISGTSTIVKVISVTIEDGSVEYGILDSGNTKDTISTQTQTVTNNGNIAEDFDIKGYDATGGGCTWSLVSGTPSTDQYKHEFSIDSGSHWSYLETSYKSLTTGISNGNNFNLDLKITMPSSSSCYNQQGTNVFVLATEAELESYTKRKLITINSSAALTDYQVKIDVTYDSDMQADFDDIRFTDSGGSTQLSYWLESKTDSTSAAFWIKVPSLSSGDNTIYMYYGNGSATSDSNGDNTFDLFDDFLGNSLNSSKWDNSGTGTLSISSSIATFSASTSSSLVEKWIYSNSFTTSPSYILGSRFRITAISVPTGDSSFRHGTNNKYRHSHRKTPTVQIRDMVEEDIAWRGSIENQSTNTWYIYETFTDDGNDVWGRRDNGSWTEWARTNAPTVWKAYIGVVSINGTTSISTEVDWVYIRKHATTEPSVSSWGSEESL